MAVLVSAETTSSESSTSVTTPPATTTAATTTTTSTTTSTTATTETEGSSMSLQTAETVINKYGTIINNSTNYRTGPSTSYPSLGKLDANTRVEVLKRVEGQVLEGSSYWYQIKPISYGDVGYVAGYLIKISEEAIKPPEAQIDPDVDFEAYLVQQGFPESYRPALRTLHAKYPKWKFTASHPVNKDGSPMKWSTVMAYESALNLKNSIPASYPVAQRSFDKGAYNYRTNSWYYSDAGFLYANPEIIAYYLDPRNFLNENHIFQFENLSYNPEIHTRANTAYSLKGSFMEDGKSVLVNDENGVESNMMYPDIFIKAAEWSKANPVFLAERVIQEVGKTGSDSVSGTVSGYEGIYNFYNIGAYSGTNPILNGLQYAKYGSARQPDSLTATERDFYLLPWTNPYFAIVGGARWISEGYINAGQKTPYYQKWNIDYNHRYGPWWHQYMGNVLAPTFEGKRVFGTYRDRGILDNAHEFVIPVMADMPAEPAPFPTDNRNRNNWLQSITVSGSMTPAFNSEVYSYSVSVAKDVERFTVNASAYHSLCKIEGTGVYSLKYGENVIELRAISERGDIRKYYITVNRAGTPQEGDPNQPAPVMTSDILDVGDIYVSNVPPQEGKNTVEYLSQNLKMPEGYRLVISANDEVVSSGTVGTGAKLSLFYGNAVTASKDYYLLIYGDPSGDGVINSHDSMAAYRFILGITQPSELEKLAMDVNKDGKVNSHDTMGIYRHILVIKLIDQK
ncbi:MAG: dockerin type I domain-containing protein [Eubacteriales bacterium]|nr:dockerin type I domain-containing protein [Eubacteriales bacterium]